MREFNKVDVVIPVYKPGEELMKLLECLCSQSFSPGRIILMNTKSDVPMPDLSNFPGTEVHDLLPEEFDHGNTRNEGLACSDADYVLFMTQDAVPADELLIEKLLQGFDEEKIGAVYARQLPNSGCRSIEKIRREENYGEKSRVKRAEDVKELGLKAYFLSDVCAMYDRKLFVSLGGFTKKTIFNEDMIFAHRLITEGFGVMYQSEAKVIHSHNYTGKQERARAFDMAVSQADHPEVFKTVSSEKEGMKLVKNTVKTLRRNRESRWIPYFFYQCFMRYEGYFLGKHYRSLPKRLCVYLSSNKNYWRK